MFFIIVSDPVAVIVSVRLCCAVADMFRAAVVCSRTQGSVLAAREQRMAGIRDSTFARIVEMDS
jgi:hypothetical protein